ncbi:TPA: site-specific DNA-methyltransferase [Candidatus Avigastranaerophilus faecigallinarum]|nr:site-specific DNA-methyltransferase [Candidatus Avigastranaerophilus faecigallinarum]
MGDCFEIMKQLPDKCIDLVLTDPPYGSGGGGFWETKKRSRFGGLFDKYEIKRTGGTWNEKYGKKIQHWDVAPTKEVFDEIFRISKNQIIWGGNYFSLPPTRCFLVWDKLTISDKFSMAMCEYAWTSFNQNAKRYEIAPQDKYRFHPTQKPLKLIEWCVQNYSNENELILDCFSGSATTAVACHNLNRNFICIEKDPEYYAKSVQRLNEVKAQLKFLL